MANNDHVAIIGQGAVAWNAWRFANPAVVPDLSNFSFTYSTKDCPDLTGVNLAGADLSNVGIYGPDRDWPGETAPSFDSANLAGADMRGASMFRTSFLGTNLKNADLSDADLTGVSFLNADLSGASFARAKLTRVGFIGARLSRINLEGATLEDVTIPDIHTWNPKTDEKTIATGLTITSSEDAAIAVDDVELAQFVALLLNTEKLRRLIDVTTAKMVLVLGRFTEPRKRVLDAIRAELRRRGYVALVFDFQRPARRDLTETISLLAHLCRFVVADITDAKSIPQELHAIVPALPSVAVQPIIDERQAEYAMFEHFRRFPWVLPVFRYRDEEHLLSTLDDSVIGPAIAKSDALLAAL